MFALKRLKVTFS